MSKTHREKNTHLGLWEHQEIKGVTDPHERTAHHLAGQRRVDPGGEEISQFSCEKNNLGADIFNLPASCREERGSKAGSRARGGEDILKYAYKCEVKKYGRKYNWMVTIVEFGWWCYSWFSSQFLFLFFLNFFPQFCSLNMLYYYIGKILFKKQSVGLGVGIENTDKNEFERLSKGTIQLCSSYSWLAHRELRSSYI